MAVTQVTKIRGDRFSNGSNGPNLTVRYLVYADEGDDASIVDGAIDPATGMAIPAVGDPHDVKTALTVQSLDADRWTNENNFTFLVVVQYGSSSSTVEPKPPGEGAKWNKSVSSSGEEIVEEINTNTDGDAIKNSAGDNYARTIPHVRYDTVITITFNTDDFSFFPAMEQARGLINDADLTLEITRFGLTYVREFPAYTLKLGNATWNIELGADGAGMFNVTIPLLYRYQLDTDGSEIGWKTQVPDVGYYYYDDDGNYLPSATGQLVNLDGTGKLLPAGSKQVLNVEQTIEAVDFLAFLDGI